MNKHNLLEMFVMVVCLIGVWFIGQSLFEAWDQKYMDNLSVTLKEACDARKGSAKWDEYTYTNSDDTTEQNPLFKCYLY